MAPIAAAGDLLVVIPSFPAEGGGEIGGDSFNGEERDSTDCQEKDSLSYIQRGKEIEVCLLC